jgi:hypothetical protein
MSSYTFSQEPIKKTVPFSEIPWSGRFRRSNGCLYVKGTDSKATLLKEEGLGHFVTDTVVTIEPGEEVTPINGGEGVQWG